MPNPFDDETARFVVLRNSELQYSLWPVFADVPPGWEVSFEEASHAECTEYIEKTWTDMRPKSLIDHMENK